MAITPDPYSNYNERREARHEGTGKWFIDSQYFSDWKVDTGSLIWIHGIRAFAYPFSFHVTYDCIAGSGKSVVSYVNPAHGWGIVELVIGPRPLMISWNYVNQTLSAQSHFSTLISTIHRNRNPKVLSVQ